MERAQSVLSAVLSKIKMCARYARRYRHIQLKIQIFSSAAIPGAGKRTQHPSAPRLANYVPFAHEKSDSVAKKRGTSWITRATGRKGESHGKGNGGPRDTTGGEGERSQDKRYNVGSANSANVQ